jgi:hypothetical protein
VFLIPVLAMVVIDAAVLAYKPREEAAVSIAPTIQVSASGAFVGVASVF